MSLELFLAVNLAADFVLILAVSRCCGRFRLRRVVLASVVCALYAPVAFSWPDPFAHPLIQVALLASAGMMISGSVVPTQWISASLLLLSAAILAGGGQRLAFLRLSGIAGGLKSALIGSALFGSLMAFRRYRINRWQIEVEIASSQGRARFTALIDTGNRLREPFSGLPVLIAEASLVEGIVPKKGVRRIGYGTLGGKGDMKCFRPDGVWIIFDGIRRRASDVWVAVSHSPLPGSCRAIAPCEFAQYAFAAPWRARHMKSA